MPNFDVLDRPTPGASLTADPSVRQPHEKPPKFTDPQRAIEELFLRMVEDEDNLDRVLDLLRQGTPVEKIAQVFLYRGFTRGLWTPDLILVLIEPTIYILLSLAEYAGIEAVLAPDEDGDIEDSFPDSGSRATALTNMMAKNMQQDTEQESQVPTTTPSVVPQSLRERLSEALN